MATRREAGFTLIELMIVVVIIGILAAVAIPNFIAMMDRAKEGSTKSNMHVFQLTTEDYSVMNNGSYPSSASEIVAIIPGGNASFRNSFTRTTGSGVAWEDRAAFSTPVSTVPGITSYGDSANALYNIQGYGKARALPLVLYTGQ